MVAKRRSRVARRSRLVPIELETLTAPALRRLIDGGLTTVVVPFGSIEDQGGHLPLGSDALLADAVGRLVADRLEAVLAPTMRVGEAEQHMAGTGTLSLRAQTLTEVAIEVGESLAKHGFRLIALVSTHGGNRHALEAAADRLNDALDHVIACAPAGDLGPEPGRHSGTWLTSVMLVLHPELVNVARADSDMAEEVGAVDAAAGAARLERFVGAIVEAVRAAATQLELRDAGRALEE
jgi:creatinine amidohydrolase